MDNNKNVLANIDGIRGWLEAFVENVDYDDAFANHALYLLSELECYVERLIE